jgi:hypothetical protein
VTAQEASSSQLWLGALVATLLLQATAAFLTRLVPTLAPEMLPGLGWSDTAIGYLAVVTTFGSIAFLLTGNPLRAGVANVEVKLYADTGSTAGAFDAGDTFLATTTTDATGEYHFTGLAPGDYIVQVTPANFASGAALGNLAVSSSGGSDPDNNTDNDDNGVAVAGFGVVSLPIRLDYNQEPVNLIGPHIERLSITAAGAEAAAGGADPSISGTGRYVAFTSNATALVSGQVDSNGGGDIFIHDRDLNTVRLVSGVAGSTTIAGNGVSSDAAMSALASHVAFTSTSTNLVAGQIDGNGAGDVFVFDRLSGTTRLVSGVQGSATTAGNGASSDASLSPEGRFVAFQSSATDLVTITDANGVSDIFLFDQTTGTTSLISLAHSNPPDVQGNGGSFNPSVSSNVFGRGVLVAFESDATNLLGSSGVDSNGFRDIFVRDTDIVRETSRVSVGVGNVQSNGNSYNASISYDARFVAFESDASNLIAGDNPTDGVTGFRDIFVSEINSSGNTIAIERVSRASDGTAGNGNSYNAVISADGRYVTFESDASNLVANDTNGVRDVFVHDTITHTTKRVSVDDAGNEATPVGGAPTRRFRRMGASSRSRAPMSASCRTTATAQRISLLSHLSPATISTRRWTSASLTTRRRRSTISQVIPRPSPRMARRSCSTTAPRRRWPPPSPTIKRISTAAA